MAIDRHFVRFFFFFWVRQRPNVRVLFFVRVFIEDTRVPVIYSC